MQSNKRTDIRICDATVQPGEKATLALPIPTEYSCTESYIPIKVINGRTPGPTLFVFSVLHGHEVNGIEIVNRLVDDLDPTHLSGAVIAIPVVNVYGLSHYPKVTPSGIPISQCFPGSEKGNFSERIAHILTTEILKQVDVCIELQTGGLNQYILPQIYTKVNDPFCRQSAKAFQAPVVTNVEQATPHSLRETAEELNIPLFVYQGGEALRLDENTIQVGLRGITNIMTHWSMIAAESDDTFNPVFSRDQEWILAPRSGILNSEVEIGQEISEKSTLGHLKDPFGAVGPEPILSPMNGVVVGINNGPLLHEGQPIFKVASFLDNERAESVITEWDEQVPGDA